ncbi:MAG: hypothetical protein Q9159_005434 [Coniocarpon cinnabarinum]
MLDTAEEKSRASISNTAEQDHTGNSSQTASTSSAATSTESLLPALESLLKPAKGLLRILTHFWYEDRTWLCLQTSTRVDGLLYGVVLLSTGLGPYIPKRAKRAIASNLLKK